MGSNLSSASKASGGVNEGAGGVYRFSPQERWRERPEISIQKLWKIKSRKNPYHA